MKSKKNRHDATRGRKTHPAGKDGRSDPQDMLEEIPVSHSPDVNRFVDDIFQKYNDFGLIDRD